MKYLQFPIIFCLFFYSSIHAQIENPKTEIGFWLGASNPFPGTDTGRALNTTLGAGLFGRFQWGSYPNFYTEVGGSLSNYLSRTERALTTIPLFGAIDYKVPAELPVSLFLKAGGGAAYVLARPANTARWDPMGFLGTEISFVAGKKIRIGLRIDYHHIFEKINLSPPSATQYPYTSPYEDLRLTNPNHYRLKDGQFFHFGLMVSFIL
ncbi:MAG: hypothetical protein H7A25_00165 [Leptospiraceae bacterium]|nr:hypothetical protein [Leptospiraceae bacterium]